MVVLELLGNNTKESKLEAMLVGNKKRQKCYSAHHGKASVLQLLGLDDLLLLGVLRVPAEWVEAEVTGFDVRLQEALSLAILRLVVSLDSVALNESTDKDEKLSELRELKWCQWLCESEVMLRNSTLASTLSKWWMPASLRS